LKPFVVLFLCKLSITIVILRFIIKNIAILLLNIHYSSTVCGWYDFEVSYGHQGCIYFIKIQ